MTSVTTVPAHFDATWSRYRDNFPRNVSGVTRHLESQIMERLTGTHGFTGLRLYYEPFISLASGRGIRLSELADLLNISRQAANQAANQIDAAGYIRRIPDPEDGRAKLIVLTARGRRLRERGLEVALALHQDICAIIGEPSLRQCIRSLAIICKQHWLMPANIAGEVPENAQFAGLLPRVSDYLGHSLMRLTAARGHENLKLSYAQVLPLIGPGGGRIMHMANLQNVSKQAISAIAGELEELGYIYRERDPADARQVLLRFTSQGFRLIEDSVISIEELEAGLRSQVGAKAFENLRDAMRKLYFTLQPEIAGFTETVPGLEQIARDLKSKLPAESLRRLAMLLSP